LNIDNFTAIKRKEHDPARLLLATRYFLPVVLAIL
jgi:hypothetical protein